MYLSGIQQVHGFKEFENGIYFNDGSGINKVGQLEDLSAATYRDTGVVPSIYAVKQYVEA